MSIIITNNDGTIDIYNGPEFEIKVAKDVEIKFNPQYEDIKPGDGTPLFLKTTQPNSSSMCKCEPFIFSKNFDTQYGLRTLFFARCEKHHITTWGYATKEEALEAWKNGLVTNNYNFCEVVND